MRTSPIINAKVVTLILFLQCFVSNGQTLSHQVISTSGGFFSTSQGSFSWTLGEVMVETYTQSQGYLTQGFHQPLTIIVTDVKEVEALNLFPVPVRDFLRVKITIPGEYNIDVIDLKGIKLTSISTVVNEQEFEHDLDFRDYASALYLVRITNSTSGKVHSYRIPKD